MVETVIMVTMNIMVDMVIIIVVVMVVMVNRTDRITRTHGTNKTDWITRTRDRQDRQSEIRDRTDQTFKLDFPGNLCRAAFAILAMFFTLKIIFSFLPLVLLRAFLGNSAPKQTFSSEG